MALVHDYLIQDGGAERVLQVFQDMWPDSPTYVLMHDPKRVGPAFDGRDIRTSFLQRLPLGLKTYRFLLPLMPLATESYDLRGYDAVLSSTSAFAKGIVTRPETVHFCYCHTPTRYLWSDTDSYVDGLNLPKPVRQAVRLYLPRLRAWDRLAADRVDRFIANSETVRRRIWRYYGRKSTVIHPPIETERFSVSEDIGDYYLAGGRLVAYKRFDIAVRAFSDLGLPLKIFGDGPETERLGKMAGPNVEFLGRVNEKEKAELYRHAIAYLNPQEEDFGITAVEAMASGRPVIAYRKGGATETVVEGVTGRFLDSQNWKELAETVRRFDHRRFDPQAIRRHAEKFSAERFREKITGYVNREMGKKDA